MVLPISPRRHAGHEHLGEQGLYFVTQFAHELGDVAVAGLAVAADGDEQHVVGAGLLDLAAGDEASAVGQQHELEHDARVVGADADFVVVEPGIQCRAVEFVIDQVVQREFEGAGLDLFGQVPRQEDAVSNNRLVAGHLGASRIDSMRNQRERIALDVRTFPQARPYSYCTVSTFEISGLLKVGPFDGLVRHCLLE